MVSQPPTIETGRYVEILVDPPSCSRVSGTSEECLLQSQIVSIKIMTIYMTREVKLRRALKNVSLEDHKWNLKSYLYTKK